MTMKWAKLIMAYVFGCAHRHTTWPHCAPRGFDYVCCLECGRELPYSMRRMGIVTEEEQVEDRLFGWAELSDRGSDLMSAFPEMGARVVVVLGGTWLKSSTLGIFSHGARGGHILHVDTSCQVSCTNRQVLLQQQMGIRRHGSGGSSAPYERLGVQCHAGRV